MVLRYFRKSANPAPQDSETPEERISQSRQEDLEHSSKEQSTADNGQSGGNVLGGTVSGRNQGGGSSTTEVSLIDAEGHVERPILSTEDETFLKRAVSEEEPPELPPRPQIVAVGSVAKEDVEDSKNAKDPGSSWKNRWAEYKNARDKTNAADDIMSAAEGLKTSGENQSDSDSDTKQEAHDVNAVLRRLDLSAINNRVVGISSDTQKLLESFNQVLKDLINGVPTAYDDLERLLKDRQKQLDTLFGSLPPFLQKLVKSVPTKMYAYFAPQVAAAMTAQKATEKNVSEKTDTSETPEDQQNSKKKRFTYIPSLKELVTKKGSVAAMLRSIVSFLETRFPALLTGTNVVMSLAVFVLLFVFWYCYKRGREVRIAKESELLDISTNNFENDEPKEATSEPSSANDENNTKLSESTDVEIRQKIELLAEDIEKRP